MCSQTAEFSTSRLYWWNDSSLFSSQTSCIYCVRDSDLLQYRLHVVSFIGRKHTFEPDPELSQSTSPCNSFSKYTHNRLGFPGDLSGSAFLSSKIERAHFWCIAQLAPAWISTLVIKIRPIKSTLTKQSVLRSFQLVVDSIDDWNRCRRIWNQEVLELVFR